jgi:hypothetical protein
MVEIEAGRKRPFRVTIIGVLSILAGLIYLFPALDILDLGNLLTLSGQTFNSGPLVLTAFVIAIANFVLGLGCLYGWRPIWFYLVIISVINFVVSIFALFNMNMSHWDSNINQWVALLIPIFWLGVATYVLLTMQSKKTKVWFHR